MLFRKEDLEPDVDELTDETEYEELESIGTNGSEYDIDITDEKIVSDCVDYHTYHGDKDVEIVRVVRDDEDYPYLLVRFCEANGNEISSIEYPFPYFYEVMHCTRNEESDMVERFGKAIYE